MELEVTTYQYFYFKSELVVDLIVGNVSFAVSESFCSWFAFDKMSD